MDKKPRFLSLFRHNFSIRDALIISPGSTYSTCGCLPPKLWVRVLHVTLVCWKSVVKYHWQFSNWKLNFRGNSDSNHKFLHHLFQHFFNICQMSINFVYIEAQYDSAFIQLKPMFLLSVEIFVKTFTCTF